MAAMTVLNLEELRKRSGVSLESISESTKISSRFLRAIESEEFEKLPGGIFDTNYIRQYATAIGQSSSDILKLYAQRHDTAEPITAVTEIRPSRGLRSYFGWLLNTTGERA